MALSDWSVRSSALVALAGLDLVNRVALLAPPSDRVLWSSLARKSGICSARPFQVESEALIRTSQNPNACLSVEVGYQRQLSQHGSARSRLLPTIAQPYQHPADRDIVAKLFGKRARHEFEFFPELLALLPVNDEPVAFGLGLAVLVWQG